MKTALILLPALLFVQPAVLQAAEGKGARPNILFIFSDDHAQHAISAYGSKVNQTPNIDRLAQGGARFASSFVTNSICTPSRATLLTGQYSHLKACRSSTASTTAAVLPPLEVESVTGWVSLT